MIPSPILYFSVHITNGHAGIMVTASHLPPEWNGFKFCDKYGQMISEGSGLEEIRDIFLKDRFNSLKTGKFMSYSTIFNDYLDFVKENSNNCESNFKVTIDTSNSVPSLFIPKLFQEVGINTEIMNSEILHFPVHDVEPGPVSMKMLSEEVVRNGSDLGIMYDSDGDRLAIVDETGRIYPDGVTVIAIFSYIYSQLEYGNNIVLDITCPTSLFDFVKKLGLNPLLSRVGHNYCSSTALKNKASFAAQFSGHVSLKESEYRDDAIFASIRLIEFVSKLNIPLSEFISKNIPKFNYEAISFSLGDGDKGVLMKQLIENVVKKGEKIIDIDGVKVIRRDGSYLIRPSNTSNIIRIMAEGRDENTLIEMKKLALEEIKMVIKDD